MRTTQMEMKERMRASAINTIGRNFGRRDLADRAIIAGTPIASFEKEILEQIAEVDRPLGAIGLTRREVSQWSLARWISAALVRSEGETFEAECHRAVCKAIGRADDREPNRVLVPFEVLQRDMHIATPGAGGYLSDSSVNVSFTAGMRARSITGQLGVQVLGGLRGSSHIPRISESATTQWLADELAEPTESTPTFVDVQMEPHTVGAYCELSRNVLRQATPAVEGIMLADLGGVLGEAEDIAVISGSGASGQTLGILNTSGIGAFDGASIDYDSLVDAQLDVAVANAIRNPAALGYATTPTVAALLKSRQRFTGTDSPLWRGAVHAGEVEGVRAVSSNAMPAATMLYGDWSQCLVGEWGVLEITLNPFAGFKQGIVGIRAFWTIDTAVRVEGAFTAATSIT